MNFSALKLKALVDADPRLGKNIAAAAGFSPGSLSHWTRGKRVPGADELAALAKVFGVPLDHFFDAPQIKSAGKFRLPKRDAHRSHERAYVKACPPASSLSPQRGEGLRVRGETTGAWEQAMAEADALVECAHSLRATLQKLKSAPSSKRTADRARREAVAIAKDFAANLSRRSR